MHLSYRPTDSLRGHEIVFEVTIQFYSPWGLMAMSTTESGISKIGFLDEPLPYAPFVGKCISPEIMEICNTLDKGHHPVSIAQNLQNAIDFINGKTDSEDVWICPICTDFQFKVYNHLISIPSGKTATYSAVAAAIGQPTATRAVASAIAKNPIAILIPCHRIVPASGGTGKYFWGADRKRRLLDYESLR